MTIPINDILVEGTIRLSVRNETGSQINAGKLVAVAGFNATEGLFTIQTADNTTRAAVGILDANLANNANGTAIQLGVVIADTTGRTVGDPVYLGTSGALTFSLPAGNTIKQEVGKVATVGASGKILFYPIPYTPNEFGSSAAGNKGEIQVRGNTAGSFSSDANFWWNAQSGVLGVGPTPGGTPQNVRFSAVALANTFMQMILENSSNGPNASTDFCPSADTGDDTAGYGDFGINGSANNDPAYPLLAALDTYLYGSGGKLTLGTDTAGKDVILHAGGFALTDEYIRLIEAVAVKDHLVKLSAVLRLVNDTTANRPTTPANGMIRYNTSINAVEIYQNGAWVNLGGIGASAVFATALCTGATPYIEVSATSMTAVCNFSFPGTATVTPGACKLCVSRAGITGTSSARIYDVTNGQEIATFSWSASGLAVVTDATLTNLPAGEAVLELQVQKNNGPASNSRVHSVRLV